MRPRLFVALGVAVLVLASCSGSGGTSAKATPSTTGPASVAARPSGGCKAASAVAAGEEKVTLTSGGAERWYFRHVPPGYTAAKPVPVVLDLHGYSEGATVHTHMSELGPYGDSHDFVTITPQGTGAVARWDTNLDSPDLTFIGDLLDEVGRTVCVDERRIYVTGLSNGAFLTSAVACKYADRIAAAAPVAGIRDIPGCKPARPVPVIAFHGTADGFVDYNGGLGAKVADLPAPDGSGRKIGQAAANPTTAKGPSIPQITAAWAKRNGCKTVPTERPVAADVTLLRFPCPRGAEVELYRVTGGGHAWPGSAFSKAVESVIGPTTSSISADQLMWKFFEAHPLTGS